MQSIFRSRALPYLLICARMANRLIQSIRVDWTILDTSLIALLLILFVRG